MITSMHNPGDHNGMAFGSTDRSDSVSSGDQSMDDNDVKFMNNNAKKLCRVCGDKAFSVNFNVVTCESCKAFFRRNALKPKEFRCPLNGRCQINVVTRRQCKKCRLEKCFQVGMVKDFIMSDEARIRKRHLIEENRAKRRMVIERKLFQQTDSPVHIKCESTASANSELDCSFGFYDQSTPLENFTSMTRFDDTTPTTATSNVRRVTYVDKSNETINVPKSVLKALINQCHEMQSDQSCRHSMVAALDPFNNNSVRSKMPMMCTCRCLCGATSSLTWPIKDKDHQHQHQHEPNCGQNQSSASNYHDDQLSLVVKGGGDESPETVTMSHKELLRVLYNAAGLNFDPSDQYVMRFDFGVSAAKSSHFDHLKFSYEALYDSTWKDGHGRDQYMQAWLTVYRDPNWTIQTDSVSIRPLPILAYVERYDNIIRRLVKLCHRMIALKYLNVRDQICLIKGALKDLMALRSLHAYIPEIDCWRHTDPLGEPTPVKILKFKGEEAYETFINFYKSFPRTFLCDSNIFLTIVALVLFTPDRPGLMDKDSVRLIRDFYHNMLLQYLTSTYGEGRSQQMLSEAVKIVDTLPTTSKRFVWDVVVELDSTGQEALLIDIFNYTL